MCGEVVAAPLSLQDTVYPILRKKSLHFCEKSKKFLKLCTAVRKKYKMKRLRRKTELPQSKPDGFASSLREGAFGMAVQFPAQAQSLRACRSPERADFPRPGEDVTAGDKRGNLSRSD